MASARMMPVTFNTSTYGATGQGRDYTALSTWESATDNDLTSTGQSAGEVLDCYDDQANFDDRVTFNGATADINYFRVLRPAAGEGHDGTPNVGVWFRYTLDVDLFTLTETFCRVHDVIITLDFNAVTTKSALLLTGVSTRGVGVIGWDCINSGTGITRNFRLIADDNYVIDCIAIDGDNEGFRVGAGSGETCQACNCVAVGNNSDGFNEASSGTKIVINCLATGNGRDFDSGFNVASDHNASEDTTAPGTNSNTSISLVNLYVNAAGHDYHLHASATTDVRDAGSDQSATFDDDIDGDLFDTWDIGMDENSPAGAGPVDVFFEDRHPIQQGMKPLTAAGMGGVLVE